MQGKSASRCQSLEDKRNQNWVDFLEICKTRNVSIPELLTEDQNNSLEETKFS